MKRIVKGPWLWIVLAVVGVLLALQYLTPNSGGDEIAASQMNDYIVKGQVKDITFVAGDQRIKAVLDDGVRSDGADVTTQWIPGTQGEIYRAALPFADRIYLTLVHREVEGDTQFPALHRAEWTETSRDDRDGFSFLTYDRAGANAP